MNGIMSRRELVLELKRFDASYVELLHQTSIEIEKLKSFIEILVCIDQKKTPPQNVYNKLYTKERKLDKIEVNLCHFAEQMDKTYIKQRIGILRESKLALIKSTSFEMDRLREIMKYLLNKIGNNNNNACASSTPLIETSIKSKSVKISHLKTENDINTKPMQLQRESLPILLRNHEYVWPEIESHNTMNDLWLVYNNKIYDITKFLKFHPGGTDVILQIACKNQDITTALNRLNHPPIAQSIMMKHYIGNVASNLDLNDQNSKQRQSFSSIQPIWDDDKHNLTLNINHISSDDTYDENDMVLIWTDNYLVNIDILDKQHENLMNIINNLYNTCELKEIQELLHRWDVHCKTEETLFYYYNFDNNIQMEHIVDHKKMYYAIKDQITDLRIKYNDAKPVCRELSIFAQAFAKQFNHHHYIYDAKYIDHLD